MLRLEDLMLVDEDEYTCEGCGCSIEEPTLCDECMGDAEAEEEATADEARGILEELIDGGLGDEALAVLAALRDKRAKRLERGY